MKRLALLALPLCFATTHVALGADDEEKEARRNAAIEKMIAPQTRAAAAQAQTQRNLPAVQRPQTSGAEPRVRTRPGFNPGVQVAPRTRPQISTEPLERAPREPQVFNPNTPPVNAPAIEQLQPGGTGVGTEGRRRNWAEGGRRGGGATRGGGIDGNQDWRNRRNDGNGDNDWRSRRFEGERNNDWRDNNNGDGRRGDWRRDERRRREWSGSRLHRRNEWSRQRRDRSWWRSRYSRFARFGSGYYYWNSGYWYPAYGYDPYFSTYTYDAPIYAYNDQDPGEVISNVQEALQQQGYYRGELDGTFGPMTRQALIGYQRDNGLPVTGEIDQDTLSALGFE